MNIVPDRNNNYTKSFRDISPLRLAHSLSTKSYNYTDVSLARLHSFRKQAAGVFLKSDSVSVNKSGASMMMCALHPQHMIGPNGTSSYKTLRCHSKWCPYCAEVQSRIMRLQWLQALNDLTKQEGRLYPCFATLTVRNCEARNIGPTLDAMNGAYKKLLDRKFFKNEVLAFMLGTEITHSKLKVIDTHPHFHVILFSLRPLEEAFTDYVNPKDDNAPKSLQEYIYREWSSAIGANAVVGELGQKIDTFPAYTMKLDKEVLASLAIGKLGPDEAGPGAGLTDDLVDALLRSGRIPEELQSIITGGEAMDEWGCEELRLSEEAIKDERDNLGKTVKYLVKYITKMEDITQHPKWASDMMENTKRRSFHRLSHNLVELIKKHEAPKLTRECLLVSGRAVRMKRNKQDKFFDNILFQNNAVFTLDCEETREQKETGQSLHQAIKNGVFRFALEQANFDADAWNTNLDYMFNSLDSLPECGYMSRHILQEWMDSTIFTDEKLSDELWAFIENLSEMMKQTGLRPWQIIGTTPEVPRPLTKEQDDGLRWIQESYDIIQSRYTSLRRNDYFDGTLTPQEVINETSQYDVQISNIVYKLAEEELAGPMVPAVATVQEGTPFDEFIEEFRASAELPADEVPEAIIEEPETTLYEGEAFDFGNEETCYDEIQKEIIDVQTEEEELPQATTVEITSTLPVAKPSNVYVDTLKAELKSLRYKRAANIMKLKGFSRAQSKERFEQVADLIENRFTVIEPMTDLLRTTLEARADIIEDSVSELAYRNMKHQGGISNNDKETLKQARAKINRIRRYVRKHANFIPTADVIEYTYELLPAKQELILASLSQEIAFPFLPHGNGKHDFTQCFGEEFTEKAIDKAEAEAELATYIAKSKAQKWNTIAYGASGLLAKDDITPRGGLIPTTCHPSTAELKFSGLRSGATFEEIAVALLDEQAIKTKVSGKRKALWELKQERRVAKGFAVESSPDNMNLKAPEKMMMSIFDWTTEQAIIKHAQQSIRKQSYAVTIMRVASPSPENGWYFEKGNGSSFADWKASRGQHFDPHFYMKHALEVTAMVEVDGQTTSQTFHVPATQQEEWEELVGKGMTRKPKQTLKQMIEDAGTQASAIIIAKAKAEVQADAPALHVHEETPVNPDFARYPKPPDPNGPDNWIGEYPF